MGTRAKVAIAVAAAAAMVFAFTATAGAGDARPIRQTDCLSTGSIALYTDSTRTTLVDVLRWVDAPTQRLYRPSEHLYKSAYVIRDGTRPGVEVTGLRTGDRYLFELSVRSQQTAPEIGDVRSNRTVADWRVFSLEGGGLIARSRNQSVRVTVHGDEVVNHWIGPTQNGLFISGGARTYCPDP